MSKKQWVEDTVVDVSTVQDLTTVDEITTIAANGDVAFTYNYDPILPTKEQLNANLESFEMKGTDQSKSKPSAQSFSMPSDINSMTNDPNEIDLSILKRSFLPQTAGNKENYNNTWTFQSLLNDIKQEYQKLNNTSNSNISNGNKKAT